MRASVSSRSFFAATSLVSSPPKLRSGFSSVAKCHFLYFSSVCVSYPIIGQAIFELFTLGFSRYASTEFAFGSPGRRVQVIPSLKRRARRGPSQVVYKTITIGSVIMASTPSRALACGEFSWPAARRRAGVPAAAHSPGRRGKGRPIAWAGWRRREGEMSWALVRLPRARLRQQRH